MNLGMCKHVEFGRLGCMHIIPRGSCRCHFGIKRFMSQIGKQLSLPTLFSQPVLPRPPVESVMQGSRSNCDVARFSPFRCSFRGRGEFTARVCPAGLGTQSR